MPLAPSSTAISQSLSRSSQRSTAAGLVVGSVSSQSVLRNDQLDVGSAVSHVGCSGGAAQVGGDAQLVEYPAC